MSNGLKCSILNLKKSILFYFSYFLNLSVIFEYEILISCVQNLDDHVMSDKYNFILTTLWWILFGLFLILVGWNYWLLELDIIFLYMLWTSKLMPKSCFLKVTRTRIYIFWRTKGLDSRVSIPYLYWPCWKISNYFLTLMRWGRLKIWKQEALGIYSC